MADVKTGQVLKFRDEQGNETHLKVMCKGGGKLWVEETRLYTKDEVAAMKLTDP